MEIKFGTKGKTYYEHQTSIMLEIDGEEYWFDMIEKGDADSKEIDVDFIPSDELDFELTDEMKSEMYSIVCTE